MNGFRESVRKQFQYYKMIGEKAFAQVPDEKLSWQFNPESNSIATIVKHLSGNMVSRWTEFLISDGEKEGRNREAEFDAVIATRQQIMDTWNAGWDCLFTALDLLKEEDLLKEVYIRNEKHTVIEAIHRQLAHYPYHVGQIVFIGKMICNDTWTSLSIRRGRSEEFNKEKFSAAKNNQ